MYLFVIKRVVNAPELMSLLLTFGISIFITNISVLFWSAEFRIVEYLSGSFHIFGVIISKPRFLAGVIAVCLSLFMYWILQKTRIGTAIRAVAYDREIAEQCGINTSIIYAIVFGIGTVLAASAGTLASTIFAFNPLIGQQFILKAFAVTVLGRDGQLSGSINRWSDYWRGGIDGRLFYQCASLSSSSFLDYYSHSFDSSFRDYGGMTMLEDIIRNLQSISWTWRILIIDLCNNFHSYTLYWYPLLYVTHDVDLHVCRSLCQLECDVRGRRLYLFWARDVLGDWGLRHGNSDCKTAISLAACLAG